MNELPGFYRLNDGFIEFAPKFVYAPTYTLKADDLLTYSLPLSGGWSWLSGPTEALSVFGEYPFVTPELFAPPEEPLPPIKLDWYKNMILPELPNPTVFDPANLTHLAAFRQLCIGLPNQHGDLVCSQHPSLRFVVEKPFVDVRSMMLHKVGAYHAAIHLKE